VKAHALFIVEKELVAKTTKAVKTTGAVHMFAQMRILQDQSAHVRESNILNTRVVTFFEMLENSLDLHTVPMVIPSWLSLMKGGERSLRVVCVEHLFSGHQGGTGLWLVWWFWPVLALEDNFVCSNEDTPKEERICKRA